MTQTPALGIVLHAAAVGAGVRIVNLTKRTAKPMASNRKNNSSVIVVRRRDSVALPPCTLGFASLAEPDTYDPEKPMFKLDACYNPPGIAALRETVERECYSESNMERLRKEMEGNDALKKLATADPQPVEAWLGNKLKDPKENAKVKLPKLVIACRAERKGRNGETYTVSIGCWDAHNNPLDIKALKLGMGSIVQPIVNANVFISKLIGFPQPKLDLVGVRVLKLVRFGGARPPVEVDEEAIKDVLGEEFAVDEDLSAYAAGSTDLPGAHPVPPSTDDTVKGAF